MTIKAALEIQPQIITDWGQTWMTQVGEVVAMDLDPKGRLFLFHRAAFSFEDIHEAKPLKDPVIFIIDPQSGRLLEKRAAGRYACPHGLKFDPDGNMWLVDSGLHQVFRYDAQGQLNLTLGEAGVPGDDPYHFNFPTDVAFLSNGRVVVSDGYGNHRALIFDPQGKPICQFGEKGSKPGQFHLPHGVTVDETDHIYIVDRANARIQVFDSGGCLAAIWQSEEMGHPWALRAVPEGFWGVDAGNTMIDEPRAGVFFLDRQGRFRGGWGDYGEAAGAFIWPHDVVSDGLGNVFVAEARGARVQKFCLTKKQHQGLAISREES